MNLLKKFDMSHKITHKILVLNAKNLEKLLNFDELRKVMIEALQSLANKIAQNFARTVYPCSSQSAIGFMPGMASNLLGYKAVGVFHKNSNHGLNPHQGIVVLLDSHTGVPQAIVDGSTVTAFRTAAVSAAATDCLSRKDASHLALIGAGRQALEHIHAILPIRNIIKIFLYSRSIESCLRLSNLIKERYAIPVEIVTSAKAAVKEADIVVTCTSAREPLLTIHDFNPGTHINAIGACRPGYQEVQLLSHPLLKIYLDDRNACLQESEEIISALNQQLISEENIIGEIGECFNATIPARNNIEDITFFKSVGLGVEDVFAANYFYQRALTLGVGQHVEF